MNSRSVQKYPITRRRRRSISPGLVALVSLIVMCLVVVFIASILYFIPLQAEQAFGPASPRLSAVQRINYSVQLMLNRTSLNTPVNPEKTETPFEIRLGESVGSISDRLVENGLIKNSVTFQTYLVYTGIDTKLQAGKYKLSPAMTPIELARQLQDATPQEVSFGVLPGWRMEEIAAALPTSGLLVTPDEFLAAAQNVKLAPSLESEVNLAASLEGFFFPGTYTFRRDISAGEMVLGMVSEFNHQITPELKAGFSKQGLSVYQAVALASLIQREAVVEEEQPVIASVFFNRLAQGMKLDSDPTVQYALGYNQEQKTWWTNPLSTQDLQIDSPYNTYRYAGLPPGPIDNPSLSALRAVAFPEKTDFFYFRARCDGSHRHVFSKTYDEHVQNACS